MGWLLLLALGADGGWPESSLQLKDLPLPAHAEGRRYKVLVDPGHGYVGNSGNTGVQCQHEADVMQELAFGLATRLSLMGPFEVRLSRKEGQLPSYEARKQAAEAWNADAVVSLHSDARGDTVPYVAGTCQSWRNDSCPGFSVLWSSEGDSALTAKRRRLSWAMTDALTEAGFPPYDGYDYAGLYEIDSEHVGSFENNKSHRKRIWFLRKLNVPTIIIETHHALDLKEVERWDEMRTRNVFANAVAKGLLDYFGER